MADRRMFTKKVTDDDNFINLSSSSQALYLHLSMSADDDGFCNQVSVAMFKAHASVQDLQALLELRYIYQFDNGVIVIKHWRMANALRKDRYTPTAFQEEMKKLCIKDNGSYTWLPDGCQMVAERLPQDRVGKDRLDKSSVVDVAPTPIDQQLDQIMSAWNEIPHTVKIKSIVPMTQRYDELRVVLSMVGIDGVMEAIQRVKESDYLSQRGHVVFDRYMNRNAIQGLLEGAYDEDYSAQKGGYTGELGIDWEAVEHNSGKLSSC